jgi:hypothetical protein
LIYKTMKDRKEIRVLVFFSGWLVTGLAIHAQIIPLDQTVADRWFYFPIVGLLGIMGVVISSFKNVWSKHTRIVVLVGIIFLIGMGIRSWIRNFDWKDGLTLASHDIKISKDSYSLFTYYGAELYIAGRYDEAINNLNTAINLAPYWFLHRNILGQVWERKAFLAKNRQFLDMAKTCYEEAMARSPYDMPFVNYANVLIFYEDEKIARDFLTKSLTRFPNSSGLWYSTAVLELLSGNKTEALQAAYKAYAFNPGDEKAQKMYGYMKNNLTIRINKADF